VGAISYLDATNNSGSQKNARTSTVTTTETLYQATTVTVTSIGTTTLVLSSRNQQTLPSNFPQTCQTNYPNGLNLNHSNYFIIDNFTTNFAQVCMKYTFDPQNATGPLSTVIENGAFNAMFNSSTMYITDSFGNASQGGSYPYDIVRPNPESFVFNATGESLVVVYTFEWSFIFSYFSPAFTQCGSPLSAIGIAQTNGDGSSGLNSSCPAFTYSNFFTAQLVGTSYLTLATG